MATLLNNEITWINIQDIQLWKTQDSQVFHLANVSENLLPKTFDHITFPYAVEESSLSIFYIWSTYLCNGIRIGDVVSEVLYMFLEAYHTVAMWSCLFIVCVLAIRHTSACSSSETPPVNLTLSFKVYLLKTQVTYPQYFTEQWYLSLTISVFHCTAFQH